MKAGYEADSQQEIHRLDIGNRRVLRRSARRIIALHRLYAGKMRMIAGAENRVLPVATASGTHQSRRLATADR